MSAETDDDRLAFLDPDDFGVTAIYKGSVNVQCIFDNDYLDLLEVESSGPAALCRTTDVSDAEQGLTFVIGSDSYTISGVEPDGTGMTLLRLEEV